MKRFFVLTLALALSATLFTACGGKDRGSTADTTASTASSTTAEATERATERTTEPTSVTDGGNVSDSEDGFVNGSNEPMALPEESTQDGTNARGRIRTHTR